MNLDLLNKITQGDCLEVMSSIEDDSVDAIIVDLPYGTTQNKWDSVIDLSQLWLAWKRITKPNAAIVCFAQQPFTTTLAASNLKQLKTSWVYEKPQGTGFLNAKRYPLKSHEDILVFANGLPNYYPQMETGHKPYVTGSGKKTSNYGQFHDVKTVNNGTRYPKTVLRYTAEKGLHSTQKPLDLISYLIRTYTLEGQPVLDCTAGSGTLAIAALNTNRNFICIEKDPEIFAIAAKRLADAQQEIETAAQNTLPVGT